MKSIYSKNLLKLFLCLEFAKTKIRSNNPTQFPVDLRVASACR